MRVLVTGGAGFIGSTIVDALHGNGDEPVALDDLSTGIRANLSARAGLIVADVADLATTSQACAGERFDAVVHCAAKTKVIESMRHPEAYRRVLVDGTKNMLRLAATVGAHRFVNISTGGAMYGETPEPASEGTPPRPTSPYGRFKLLAEDFVSMSASLRTVTLRLANVYGPRQRSDLEGGVVSIFLDRWRSHEPITVFGDGRAERDYIHVDDCAAAVVRALRSDVRGIYNIGAGRGVSVNQLIEMIGAVLGPPASVRYEPSREGELQRAVLDPAKAERAGLLKSRIPLETGLGRTIVALRARASRGARQRAARIDELGV
jgi:UDP-glucose 4-epimerase